MNKVVKSFPGKAINRAGIYLFSKKNATKYGHSIDISRRSFEKEFLDEAIQFLKQPGGDPYLEIVCAE